MSLQKLSDSLAIFAKYCPKGMQESNLLAADPDVIYMYVNQDALEGDSEDGQKLKELGWEPHYGGNWALKTV